MENLKILLAGPGTGKTTKVKEIVKEKLASDPSTNNILVISFTNATVQDLLSELKEVGITESNCRTLHSYALYLNHDTDLHILESNHEVTKLSKISQNAEVKFETLCKILNCITFDQMIINSKNFINANPKYAHEKIGNIDLLLVDEYQDFNESERMLVNEIIKFAKEAIVLGDDDQSIYGFKDADAQGIIGLFNTEDIVRIEHDNVCYRCPKDVVLSLNNLIANNKDRIDKTLVPFNEHTGLETVQTKDQDETNELIFNMVEEIRSRYPSESILILSSVGFASEPIIKYLETKGLPVANMWGSKLDIQTMKEIWWLQTIFGEKKLLSTVFLALENSKYSYQRQKIYELIKETIISGSSETDTVNKILQLNLLDESLASNVYREVSIDEFLQNNIGFKKYKEYLVTDNPSYGLEKLPYMFSETESFDQSKINFMSIHKSKGLSAHHVVIVGLVEGILPRGSDSTNTLEAQRRLFFVGVSRAKKDLKLFSQMEWPSHLVHKVDNSKFKFRGKQVVIGQTSSFVTELKIS